MTDSFPFALYYHDEAYSLAGRIMGRQAAGQSFLQGLARQWPTGQLHAAGPAARGERQLRQRLQDQGFGGTLRWSTLPDLRGVAASGALYYPAPPDRNLAAVRNLAAPASFSLIGVTHTLASLSATDQVANLILPPFQPWDALICTSRAAHTFVTSLHADMRDYWRETIGAAHFVEPALPVIPLGIDAAAFGPQPGARAAARAALGLAPAETAFLFAGRLSFHAKANPAPVYQALEQAARTGPLVCVEAGLHANAAIREAYRAAQAALAPSVRFIWIDGRDAVRYQQGWQAADVFVSLSDNLQETFGITPLEAMAAGLPVLVSDWDGYQDTVRDGIDGFRIPTVVPPAGCGAALMQRHALQRDSYDAYIGAASMATVVAPAALAAAVTCLASDPARRAAMGAAGQARVAAEYDWPVILRRYADLAHALARLRPAAAPGARAWPQRADPFRRFGHYGSATVARDWQVRARPDAAARLPMLQSLAMANYVFGPGLVVGEALPGLLDVLGRSAGLTVEAALAAAGMATPAGLRALMWLWKFDLIEAVPPNRHEGRGDR